MGNLESDDAAESLGTEDPRRARMRQLLQGTFSPSALLRVPSSVGSCASVCAPPLPPPAAEIVISVEIIYNYYRLCSKLFRIQIKLLRFKLLNKRWFHYLIKFMFFLFVFIQLKVCNLVLRQP